MMMMRRGVPDSRVRESWDRAMYLQASDASGDYPITISTTSVLVGYGCLKCGVLHLSKVMLSYNKMFILLYYLF